MKNEKAMRPFGIRDKVGYMFGDFGNDFTFLFASTFLMIFYTKVLGIGMGMVGTLFLVARCIDAFTDVTMGQIVDRAKEQKDGRFRPWIRRMCGPVALASFLMYQSALADASMTIKVVYMFVTYILWGSVFYTSINIPYGSMASVLSSESDDRSSLSTFRSVGASLASLIVCVAGPMMVYTTDEAGNQIVEGSRFTLIAGIFSVSAVICYLLCYFMTTERVKRAAGTEEKTSVVKSLKSALTSRALIGIIAAAILLLLASLMAQSVNQYVFIDYFKNKTGLSLLSLCAIIPSFLLAPFIVPLSRKFGKRELGAAGCIVGGLSSVLLFFMHTKSMGLYIAVSVVGYIGFGFFNMIIWALITDVIDDQEVRTGKREDGTVYAVYSFARKIGQALAGGMGAWALGLAGYNSSVQVQTQEVADKIYGVATMLPGILYIGVGLCLLFLYPLSKKKVEENILLLKERRRDGVKGE